MKRILTTAVCSLLLSVMAIGVAANSIGKQYNSASTGSDVVIFSSAIAGTAIDSDTVALAPQDDILADKDSGFDILFDDVSYPGKYLSSFENFKNNNHQIAAPVLPPVVEDPVPPVEQEKPPTPVTRPNNTISNIAGVIKGRDYGDGINVFQGNGSGITTDMSDLQAAINKGSSDCGFIAIRLSDGASVAYNVREDFRCASTYKALVSLYIYKKAEAGELSLDEKLTYTRSDYYSGSGIIKSYSVGTRFTLRQLADYSIRYSDNIAFVMLQRYIDDADLIEFVKSLGCENYSQSEFAWPNITALDASLWWAEIYKYSQTGKYGQELYNVYLNATHTIIRDALGKAHSVAHKSGSISHYYHDCGVVESEDPYILIMLSYTPRSTTNNSSYVNPIIREIDKIMNP